MAAPIVQILTPLYNEERCFELYIEEWRGSLYLGPMPNTGACWWMTAAPTEPGN